MQNQQGMWLPLVASIGIGAAAFYSMTRGEGMGKTAQQFVPFVAGMGGQDQSMHQQPNGEYQSSNGQQNLN